MSSETPTSTSPRAESFWPSTRTVNRQESHSTPDMNDLDSSSRKNQTSISSLKRQRHESQGSQTGGATKRFRTWPPTSQSTQTTPDHESAQENDVANADQEHEISNKENLETKSYAELKAMYRKPELRTLYGDELLPAIYKANFELQSLDLLNKIDRIMVPEEFHSILDQVVQDKTFERQTTALDILDGHLTDLCDAEWDRIEESFKNKSHAELEIILNNPMTKKQEYPYERILRSALWRAKLAEASYEDLVEMDSNDIPAEYKSVYNTELKAKFERFCDQSGLAFGW